MRRLCYFQGIEVDYLYSLGNILILLSLSFRKVLFIRIIFALSDFCFVAYGLWVEVMPMVYWAVASLIVNFVQIGLLVHDMIPQYLNEELQAIKDQFFETMTTNEFLKLIKLSRRGISYNQLMLEKGAPVEDLLLITEGYVYITLPDSVLRLGRYHFIGEMSYFSDGTASATIHAREPVEYLYWHYKDLRRLQVKKPQLFMKMVEAMGKDIMLKMIKQNQQPTVDA